MKQWIFLLVACFILFLLWLPGLQYPIVSDSAQYALLGESVWHGEGYQLFGVPYAKHLPLHAILSYPFSWMFGLNIGMKIASLVAGMGVLIASYIIGRDHFSKEVGMGTVAVLLLHHGFIWMTVVGSADLLFAALFLFGLWAFSHADDDRWYLLAGLCFGLACLTRYNGMPLLGFYLLYGILVRKQQRSLPFWCGLLLGSGLFGIWLLRNFHIFGNPLYTEYTGELGVESAGPVLQIVSNFFYYLSPLQNILPVLLLFAFYGMWKNGREQLVLLCAMAAVWILTAVWWVQAMRFAFPVYPLLMMFGVWGILEVRDRIPKWFLVPCSLFLVAMHLGALCLYSYGSCNALFDRTIGIIPPNLGITSEGFYATAKARDYLNEHAQQGERLYVNDDVSKIVWSAGVFSDDLVLTSDVLDCPYYRITPEPAEGEEIIFTTQAHPQTSVVLHSC